MGEGSVPSSPPLKLWTNLGVNAFLGNGSVASIRFSKERVTHILTGSQAVLHGERLLFRLR